MFTFEPADPPRTGVMVAESPGGAPLTVATADGPARVLVARRPVAEALPELLRGRQGGQEGPAAFWGAAAAFALSLVARGRIRPSVSPAGFDAWRAGPLDETDTAYLRALAEAMPARARCIPLDAAGLRLAEAETLLSAFVDAVADAMPRPGDGPYAAEEPSRVEWVPEDAGRVSLRVECEDGDDFRAVVQVHDGPMVTDAREVWARGGDQSAVVVALRRAAQAWEPAGRLLELAVPDEVFLTDAEVSGLLADGAVRLAAAGVEVHWPKELTRGLRARAVVRDFPDDKGLFSGTVALDWRLAFGGVDLDAAELDLLAEAHRPVVRLRDQWLLLDAETARRARERELTPPLSPVAALGALLSGVTDDGVEVSAEGRLAELREAIAEPEQGAPLPQPDGLAAALRDYQLRGLRWLARMTDLGLGGCLADDMGLGKTITLIALHLHRAETDGPTLVVCPASLLGTWEREIRRFAPGTAVARYHGTQRTLPEEGFVLTTYGTMRVDADALAARSWGLVVADEAQQVKNRLSGTARELRKIPAAARVALTGTPVENNLTELWAILDWTTPGLLGPLPRFRSRWARPIEAGDPDTAARFAALIRPFLLRRRKSDPGIAPELPPKTETDNPVALTAEQAALYEATVRELMEDIRGADGMARRGQIVKLLTGLKQICNHPAQYLKEPDPVLLGRSGKLELLDDLVAEIIAEDGAVLVFTQYVAMARLLQTHLRGQGVPVQLLHGGTPVAEREAMVERFQAGDVPVFLLSLKAAGTGLTLTRADHVVHYDRWWNPAVEDQATDRAYRIGQTRPVQVHRLIAEGTVEDRIAALLASKRALADSVLAAGESALTELSNDDLADLVELR